MIIAFDLDGTLADITHRLWPAFFRACNRDVEIPHIVAVQQALAAYGHTTEIWSGRSDEVRTETETWLLVRNIRYRTLRMRKAGDYRPDHVVKQGWLDGLAETERPQLAFDDGQAAVDMWRRNGIRCCQVAKGDF
jgi:phosphoglycolate phosphatase-like HAD superfamily hydrolase